MEVIRLELAKGFYKMTDSMCFDSGLVALKAELIDGDNQYNISVIAEGDVRVFYKDNCYRCASQMPDELLDKFESGAINDDPDYYCDMNNWWEVEVYKNGDYIDWAGGFMDFCPADFTDEEDIKQWLIATAEEVDEIDGEGE